MIELIEKFKRSLDWQNHHKLEEGVMEIDWDTDSDHNIYYYPETYGLEIVAAVDFAGMYEFDMVVVWRNKSGDLFWATDNGCSCRSPFENHTSLDSLERLTNWEYFEQTVKGMSERYSSYDDRSRTQRAIDFLYAVELAYRGQK